MKNQYRSPQSSSPDEKEKDHPPCSKKDPDKEWRDKDNDNSSSNDYIFIIIIVIGGLIFCALVVLVFRKFFRKKNNKINSSMPVIEINIPKSDDIPLTNIMTNKSDLKTVSPCLNPITKGHFYFIGNSHNTSRSQTSIKPNDNILILDEKDSGPRLSETKNDKRKKRWRPPIDKKRRAVQKREIVEKDIMNKENNLSPNIYTVSEEKKMNSNS